ncbi:MAG TPA: winged helix-turn-helix transcriptional regulator [Ktedonobacterales bacterium]|nr:winged helix-turn-helix transcriptional regulator [Ktedonobacterales bacterium]
MSRLKKTTECPLGGAGVGGKWKFWIWYYLLDGTKRFGELRRLIPQASRQMLTIQLRELEQVGVLHRQTYMQVPPKIEYSLTELARRSEPMFRQFYQWGQWNCDQNGLEYDDWLVSLGGRWKFWIWYYLLSGTKRFGELSQLIPQANRQTLTMQLRDLEHMGVLHRQASAHGPLKVEYSLTELGRRSGSMLRQTYAWGRWFCDQIGVEYDWPENEEAAEHLLPTLIPALSR